MPLDPVIARGIQPIDISNPLMQIAQLRQRDQALQQDQQYRNALIQEKQQTYGAEQQKAELKQSLARSQWLLSNPSVTDVLKSDPQKAQALSQGLGVDVLTAPEEEVRAKITQHMQGIASQLGEGPPEPKGMGALYPIVGPKGPIYEDARGAQGKTPYRTEPREPTGVTSVLGPDGKPIYVRTTDAAGMTPANAPQAGAELTGEGLDLAAETYRVTGKLPPGLFKIPGATLKVINRAAEQATALGDDASAAVLNQQAFAAKKSALGKLQTQKSLMSSFERTAGKNLDLALEMSAKTDRSGSPIINKGLIHWRQNVTGDPDTASFVNALTAARQEYAKILSGATGAAGITDAARKEADDLFSTATSDKTLRAVIATAHREMDNRIVGFDEEIASLRESMAPTPPPAPAHPTSTPPPVEAASTGAAAPPASRLREGFVTTFQNGQKWTLQGGQPVQVQ